jgi:hypothetical protein
MKMRSILVLISSFSLFSFSAFAADSSSGCGLGWEVTQKQSLVSSAIRSTTNAILPNTFSMTFGTSGCQKHSVVKNESEQMYFVEANLDQLALDMAQGDGEYLRGFAAVMGCESAYGDFSSFVQKQYPEIFSGSVTPTRVLQQVKRGIRSNAALANTCGATT